MLSSFFVDDGCIDNYEPISDTICVRISSIAETYDDAQDKCASEGAHLLYDINQEIHVSTFFFKKKHRPLSI